jgi:hypothetical protein
VAFSDASRPVALINFLHFNCIVEGSTLTPGTALITPFHIFTLHAKKDDLLVAVETESTNAPDQKIPFLPP